MNYDVNKLAYFSLRGVKKKETSLLKLELNMPLAPAILYIM
jgi:hypothetical protein